MSGVRRRAIAIALTSAAMLAALATPAAAATPATRYLGLGDSLAWGDGASVPSEQSALFRYRRGPIAVDELSAEHRDDAVIRDITYTGQGGTPVIDLILADDPHKAVIETRHSQDGPNTFEQISGR